MGTTYIGINTLNGVQATIAPTSSSPSSGIVVAVCNDNTSTPGSTGLMSAYYPAGFSGWSGEYTGFNTRSTPGVTFYNGLFNVYYGDPNSNIQHLTSPDGHTWTAVQATGLGTSGGIAAVANGSTMHLFFRDPAGGGLMHSTSPNATTDWTTPDYLGINANSGVGAAVFTTSSNVTLVCAVCQDNGGGGVMIAILNPTTGWSSQYIGINTSNDPSIAAIGNTLYLYAKDPGGGALFQYTSSNGTTWSAPTNTGNNTSGGCCAVAYPAINPTSILLFYRDPGGGGVMESD